MSKVKKIPLPFVYTDSNEASLPLDICQAGSKAKEGSPNSNDPFQIYQMTVLPSLPNPVMHRRNTTTYKSWLVLQYLFFLKFFSFWLQYGDKETGILFYFPCGNWKQIRLLQEDLGGATLLNMRTWSERSTVWTQHISSGVQALIWWLRLGSSIEEAKGEIPEGKPLAGKGRLEPLGHVRKEKANLFICFASPE